MRETERQIQAYKARLPHMRERVMAALALLAVAAIMMVSTSYAWVVLSTSPEIKGINTTITANGNLEIALANGTEITEPADSAVGDGGKDLIAKNITWGNLVNLGDPAYGLENIVLRPATLNTNSLLTSPLYAAGYGSDGRVEGLESDFAFASWDTTAGNFLAYEDKVKYGVRTIASVVYGETDAEKQVLADLAKSADGLVINAQTNLWNLGKSENLTGLTALMQKYVQEMATQKVEKKDPKVISITKDELQDIYNLMVKLHDNMVDVADALAECYNIRLYRYMGPTYYAENRFKLSETKDGVRIPSALLTASDTEVDEWFKLTYETTDSSGKTIQKKVFDTQSRTWLNKLRTIYTDLGSDIEDMSKLLGRNDVVWENLDGTAEEDKKPELYPFVNNVVNIPTAKVNGTALGSMGGSAMAGLLELDIVPVEAQTGYLKDVDQLIGGVPGFKSDSIYLTISVTMIFPITKTVEGVVTTYATNAANTEAHALEEEYKNALAGESGYKGTNPLAKDTFGLALDFFLRTNASNASVVLQGSPVYETRKETVTVAVGDKTYSLYTVTITDGDASEEITAYYDGTNYYTYDQSSGTAGTEPLPLQNVSDATPVTEDVQYIVGYNGVNRVWDEDQMAGSVLDDGVSTTQGAGSCYVFYPANPEDQEKSLQLLEHFTVAFIDDQGNLLTTAYMDTANAFEQPGKVTVPLVLSNTSSSVTGTDGNPIYTITKLEQNKATFITALVYLNGMNLTNDQVLAAGEIQGQLNIQFGTTTDLTAVKDPVLMAERCTVTATMEGATSVKYDTATAADMLKTVTVAVVGYEPKSVKAYFQREISSTQGIRQGVMEFQSNDEGKWVGTHQFTAPGKYILREVQLDGVTYELDSDPITFTVEGFTITSIACKDNNKTHMTADKQYTTSVEVTFASSSPDKMPTSVKGAFIHTETGNRTTVYFTPGSGSKANVWTGSATFTTSGEYKMTYLEISDSTTGDQYTGLETTQQIKMDLYLGLTASVETTVETTFGIKGDETREIPMLLAVRDDSGNIIPDLKNVKLYYKNVAYDTVEKGLDANMEWDRYTQRYKGTFPIDSDKAGTYVFRYVVLGDVGTLTAVTSAPTITAISYNPPVYVEKEGFGEVFSLNNDASFTIVMEKTGAPGCMDAVLKNTATGDTYYIRDIADPDNDGVADGCGQPYGTNQIAYTFKIPAIDNKQTGTWTLEGVYMTNVTSDKGVIYVATEEELENGGPHINTDDKPKYTVSRNYYYDWLYWPVANINPENESVTITVLSDITVSLTDNALNQDTEFGKDADGKVTGLFGATYDLPGLELSITANGKPLSEYGLTVTGVELKYSYDQSGVTSAGGTVTNPFGNYTVSSGWNTMTGVNFTQRIYNKIAIDASDATKYSVTAQATDISVAGRYKAGDTDSKTEDYLTLTVKDAKGATKTVQTKVTDLDTPVYTIYSAKPIATITGISPDGENDGYWRYTTSTGFLGITSYTFHADKRISSKTAYSATIYPLAQVDNSVNKWARYVQLPQATIDVQKIGFCNSATMELGNSGITFDYTPDDTSDTKTFGSTGDTWVGAHRCKAYTGIGSHTITQIVLRVGDNSGIEVTFDLDNPIEINCPQP